MSEEQAADWPRRSQDAGESQTASLSDEISGIWGAALASSIVEAFYNVLFPAVAACAMQLKTCTHHIRLENCSRMLPAARQQELPDLFRRGER